MCQHVPGLKEKFLDGGKLGYRKEIVLAKHHFPMAVYKHLKSRQVTSLLKESKLKALVKKEPKAQYDQAGKLAALVKTMLPPGKLLEDYTSQEKQNFAAKAKLCLVAPAAAEQDVVDIVNALPSQKEQVTPAVEEKSPLDRLLPGATYTIREMQALLKKAKLESKEQANEPQDEEQFYDAQDGEQTKQPQDKKKSKKTQDKKKPNEPKDKKNSKQPQDDKKKSKETQDMSSAFIPSKEQCVTKIQSDIKTLGVDHAKKAPSFCGALSALRRLHMDFSPIELSADGKKPSYLYPCKDVSLTNSHCDTFRIAKKLAGEGMFCATCAKATALNSQNDKKRGESTSSAPEKNSATRKKRKAAP